MLGILYIVIFLLFGYSISKVMFPNLVTITEKTYSGKKIQLNPYLVLIPAWFSIGALSVTWATYLTAYVFRGKDSLLYRLMAKLAPYVFRGNVSPLLYANAIVLPLFLMVSILILVRYRMKHSLLDKNKINKKIVNTALTKGEIIFLILVAVLVSSLMWTTFFMKDNQLYVGATVFSDFSPHLGMIRSFSVGNNFPTEYSHFAGEDIRYHFMFQFLVGNLEYLGLRLDYAFNLPSIISLLSTFLLLYVITVKITGKRVAGYLSCLFMAYRSSESLFTFLSEVPKGTSIWKALNDNVEFIGYTTNEKWGLWNLNVYCNQRHLAFSLTVLLFILLLYLPHMYAMFNRCKGVGNYVAKQHIDEDNYNKDNFRFNIKRNKQLLKQLLYTCILYKKGWFVKDYRLAIFSGLLLGAIAFWNGAVLIAALLVLGMIAIMSERRLEFLIMALLSITLSMIQTKFFIHGEPITPNYLFGFIAENPTVYGVLSYLRRLLGILPYVLFAVFLKSKGIKRWLLFSFTLLILFAFTISLTVDVTVNHKYIMIAVILLGILVADFITQLYENKDVFVRIGCIIMVLLLTGTGFYDYITVLRKNQKNNAVILEMDDKLTSWIKANSDSKDIFLTSNYALNRVVLGGAMLYQGWQYFAWSAGYDTFHRDKEVKQMYEAITSNELISLVKKNNISFIIVDRDNRISEAYEVNEDTIKNTFALVYQDGDGEWTTCVYDTHTVIEE